LASGSGVTWASTRVPSGRITIAPIERIVGIGPIAWTSSPASTATRRTRRSGTRSRLCRVCHHEATFPVSDAERDTTWAMSQENVEIVRAAIDAGNRQDIEAGLALMGPEPEWVNSPTALEPGVRRGRDEVAAVFRGLLESLTDGHWEVDQIHDRGEQVIALGRLSRRMPGSDARLEDRSLMSYRIRSGKIVQIQVLGFGRDEVQAALEAAGLSE
jgi:ketosteroid isomerase-like protein